MCDWSWYIISNREALLFNRLFINKYVVLFMQIFYWIFESVNSVSFLGVCNMFCVFIGRTIRGSAI